MRTLTPTGPSDTSTNSWVFQTPHNPTEAILHSTLVKTQISDYQGSSPTTIFSAFKQMAKGIEALAHSVTLLSRENCTLRKANEALSKHRKAKKTRVRQRGILSVEDAQDILAQRDAREQAAQDRCESRDGNRERLATVQQCGITQCGYLDVTRASVGEWGLSRTKVCSGAVGVLRVAMSGSRQGIGRGRDLR